MSKLWILLFLSATTWAENQGTGLQTSIAADIVGQFGQINNQSNNRLEAREAEVLFFAPIDQLFDGTLSMAAHQERGNTFFELHEMYIGSSKLIPRSRFRLGQFFLGFGRLNQFHRHDWPFTTAPKVQSSFFDREGVLDTGLEYSFLFPTPFYLDLTVGLTNGWAFGHAHSIGTKPKLPTHYARLVTYNSLFSGGGMQTGLNYLGRNAADGSATKFLGLDLTAKWRENQTLVFLLQSEAWYRILSPATGGDAETTLGYYVYSQYGFSQQWYAGLRIDGYTVTSLQDAGGGKIGNLSYGLVPTVTFKASEFSTIRASYSFLGDLRDSKEQSPERIFELQAVFLLGTHPSHDF